MLRFHGKAESDRSRSPSDYVRNSNGNVKKNSKSMDRRRHPLQPRQLGGHSNYGKNDDSGKNDDNGMDGRTGTNVHRHPDPPIHFANFFASQSIFSVDFAYRHQRMSCTREDGNTPPYAHDAPQTHIFSCRAQLFIQCTCIGSSLCVSVRVTLQSHSIVSSPVALSGACQPILFTFPLRWRRNSAQTAPIHGAVRDLAVWLNKARQQDISPTA